MTGDRSNKGPPENLDYPPKFWKRYQKNLKIPQILI